MTAGAPDTGRPSPAPSGPFGRVLAVMDFDGTATTADCMPLVLGRFLDDWRGMYTAARAEGLSQVAAVGRGLASLRATQEEVVAAFVEVSVLRPGLAGFVARVLGDGGEAAVVSAGVREAIEAVLRGGGVPAIPVYAGELMGDPARGYSLDLKGFGDCPLCGPGFCKGPVVRALRRPGQTVVAFGDGARDLCMAREADLVFARGALLGLCEQEGLQVRELTDFDDASVQLAVWLDGCGSPADGG